MMWDNCYAGGWFMGFLGPLFWILLVVLVLWALGLRRRGGWMPGGEHRDPMDYAKERYAKGELTKEQFDKIKADLK